MLESEQTDTGETGHSPGLFDTVRRLASSILGLLHNRLSLAAIELQEEKLRVVNLLMGLGIALALASAGLLVAIGGLAFFFWERAGYLGVAGLAVLTLAASFGVVLFLRRQILRGPRPFAVTVEEFGKDLECLRPRE